MDYYVIHADKIATDIIITTNEKEAIKHYDELVDKYPEFECFHYNTWKEEDPEGYNENCSIEDFAVGWIYVTKFNNWKNATEYAMEIMQEYGED